MEVLRINFIVQKPEYPRGAKRFEIDDSKYGTTDGVCLHPDGLRTPFSPASSTSFGSWSWRQKVSDRLCVVMERGYRSKYLLHRCESAWSDWITQDNPLVHSDIFTDERQI
ncbi:hypothetical protein [Alicyclobacillus sp. SP_1]|uniref:Uncharacterized protein n=1 Tax=Ferroacidibacillus organovorans TaxID=1765683 RepID=A0A1V4ESZ1_9BACL|nr:hypothetical protein [Alicyclobacillus sp. SP_1]OPG16047.1 hypothetical protein B2M26_08340 [Ferroacidibacillus organovorans]